MRPPRWCGRPCLASSRIQIRRRPTSFAPCWWPPASPRPTAPAEETPMPMLAAIIALLTLLLPALARADDTPAPLDQVQRADGALVVPDHFLRRWDPVTV